MSAQIADLTKQLTNSLARWKFDPLTSVATLLVLPVLYGLARATGKFIKTWAVYAFNGAAYWLSRSLLHSLSAQLTLRQYCSLQLHADNQYLFVPSRQDIKLPVDDIFITLTMDHFGGAKERYSHRDLLETGNRIRIMGDPGAGKSSLAKRLFRDACRQGSDKPKKARLPYLLELKTLKPPIAKEQLLGDWLLKQIRDAVGQAKVYKMNDCFDTYVTTNGVLLLLDGLDEVSKQNYPRVRLAIDQLSVKLAAASSENTIVVTMRTQFYHQVRDDFRESIGQAFFIRPFSPSDIFEFLSKWPFRDKRSERRTQIYQDLTDRPTLREMCANPLVLSMYVAEYEATSGGGVVPETRTEFYQRVTEELIIKRRLKQLGKTQAPSKLREQRERILGLLAYEHLLDGRQPANSLRWSDAVRVTRQVLNCDQEAAKVAFLEISTETGLISQEREQESFRFIHLTFCEFLAAYEAVQGQKDGWTMLLRCHRDFQGEANPQLRSRLVEVLPFAIGLTQRVRRPSILSQIAELEDYRLLARCFLETKLYEHETWPKFLRVAQDNLLAGGQDWDEAKLRDLHLFGVVAKDQQQCAQYSPGAEHLDLSEFYQLLASRRHDQLSKLVSAFASQDAAAAFRVVEACGLDFRERFPEVIISSCDQPPFCELALQMCRSESLDAHPEVWAALVLESALWSKAVARYLDDAPRVPQWNKVTGGRNRWTNLGSSHYYQLIDLAVQGLDRDEIPAPCVLVSYLPIFAPPSFATALGSLAALFFGVALPFLSIRLVHPGTLRVWLVLLSFCIISLSYLWMLRKTAQGILCRTAINLRSLPSVAFVNDASHEALQFSQTALVGTSSFNSIVRFVARREWNSVSEMTILRARGQK